MVLPKIFYHNRGFFTLPTRTFPVTSSYLENLTDINITEGREIRSLLHTNDSRRDYSSGESGEKDLNVDVTSPSNFIGFGSGPTLTTACEIRCPEPRRGGSQTSVIPRTGRPPTITGPSEVS